MLKQKNLFIAATLVTLTLLTGCSQSDSNSSSTDWKADQEVIVINGHTLPPEPDPAINNATLLGVDSNDNGVRDDVERKIYLNYDKEVTRQMLMQSARLEQRRLAASDLVENAQYWEKFDKNDIGCMGYLYDKYDINLYKPSIEDDVYNTKERIKKYMRYNQALSGGVYGTENRYEAESSCDFNITKALAADQ